MALTLHYHPLSSFCWKVLVALYENATPFAPQLVDLGSEAARAAFRALSPFGKMPVLQDDARGCTVIESTVIIEYLQQYHAGPLRFLPAGPDAALQVRLLDRLLDAYLHQPMQRVIADRLRQPQDRDALNVSEARAVIATAYRYFEAALARRRWAAGDEFTLADCAAAPALYYADRVAPLGPDQPALRAYLDRLQLRPSFARVLREAEPFFQYFPQDPDARATA